MTNCGGIGNKIRSASHQSSWKEKISKAFWRRSSIDGVFHGDKWDQLARPKLALLSIQYPKHLDATFTQFVQGAEMNPAMLAIPELKGSPVSPQDSLKYKYLVDVDGNTCSWQRMYWILLSNCTLFKQMTDNIEWYYGPLAPNVHFIPIKADLSDLVEKIDWARSHDREVHMIAKRGTAFAKKHLNQEMVYLYLYLTLVHYAKLQGTL